MTRNGTSTLARIALVAALLFTVQHVAASQEPEEPMAEAWRLLNEGKLKEAVWAFEKIDEAAGDAEEARLGLATAHYKLGNYKKSISLTRSLLENPQSQSLEVRALHIFAISLYSSDPKNKQKLKEAEKALRREIEMIGGITAAVGPAYSLATVLQALEEEREAIAILQEALDAAVEPDDASLDPLRVLGCKLRRSVNYESPPPPPLPQVEPESTVIHIGGKVKAPQKIWGPQPEYPKKLQVTRSQGIVIAQVIIDKEGCVKNVKILKSFAKEAGENTVRAFRHWVFRPALLDGRPVDVYYNLTTNMRLQ